MEDLRTDASPIPELLTTDAEREEGQTSLPTTPSSNGAEQPSNPIKNTPQTMHLSGCSKVHIGPLYNCVDPASVRTPPPGATSPIHSFGQEPKKPPKALVEALLESTREVSDGELDAVSCHAGYAWRHLGRLMKYTDGQLDNIDADNRRVSDKAYAVVAQWRDRESKQATVANLTRLLMTAKAYDVVLRLRP